MAKITKKRITEVAAKLRSIYGPSFCEWPRAGNLFKSAWRRVAMYVLTELQPADGVHAGAAKKMFLSAKRGQDRDRMQSMRTTFERAYGKKPRVGRKPKSCRIVDGKVVCS